MRGLIIAIGVLALLAIVVFLFVSSANNDEETTTADQTAETNTNDPATNQTDTTQPDTNAGSEGTVSNVTITYTDNGFSPSRATLASGGTITWVNNSGSSLQIGVDPHPSHTGDKAITGGEFVLALEAGASETITVNSTGNFGYHNHLDSGDTGTVVVQ